VILTCCFTKKERSSEPSGDVPQNTKPDSDKLGLTPRSPNNSALFTLCHCHAYRGWQCGGLLRAPVTFIHSKTSAKTLHAGPRKMKRPVPGEVVRALSREPDPLFPRLDDGEFSSRPNAKRPARRPPAPALAGPRLCLQQLQAPGLPGRAAARPPWEDQGARFLLLPPAPRAEAVARETELAVRRGLGPFRAPCIFAVRPPQPLYWGEAKRQRGGGEPPTHLRARAATPGGQRHPEPPQPLPPPPPETPLRKRDHWSEAATLPDMVPPSSLPTSPFPHARQPSRGNYGTEVRLRGSDVRSKAARRWCPHLSVPLEKWASEHWFLVQRNLELNPQI
jgi:hypothetical protein